MAIFHDSTRSGPFLTLSPNSSYWCTTDEEEEERVDYETPTKVAATADVADDNEAHESAVTDAPAESYCDCLAPSECATLVDLFHHGRFHDLMYYDTCGSYDYQQYFCCPPLTADQVQPIVSFLRGKLN